MKFTVTFKENPIFIFFLAFGSLMVWFGITAPRNLNNLELAALGMGVIAFILIIRFRFYVLVTDEMLEVRRFLFTRRLRWAGIHKARSVAEEIYKKTGRLGAPYAYDFITGDGDVIRINFKLFSRDCFAEVFKRVPETKSHHHA